MDAYEYYCNHFREPMRDLLYEDPRIPYDPDKAVRLRAACLAAYPQILQDNRVAGDEADDNALILRCLGEEDFIRNPYPVPPTAAETREEKKYALLLRQYIHELLAPLSASYARGEYTDVYHKEVAPVDFHGKKPVWVIWWQGEEQAPEVVRLCLQSIRAAVPAAYAELILITEENAFLYAPLPPRVQDLFREGNINRTQLSDILRTELLSRYGGLYLDATYLVTESFPAGWFVSDAFYTPKFTEPCRDYVSGGMWRSNFILEGGKRFFSRYLRSAFYLYLSGQDVFLDYFLIDIIVEEAIRTVPAIRDLIEGVAPSQPHIEHLVHNLNAPYTPSLEYTLRQDTFIYKLTYKRDLYRSDEQGRKTLYGWYCDQYEL